MSRRDMGRMAWRSVRCCELSSETVTSRCDPTPCENYVSATDRRNCPSAWPRKRSLPKQSLNQLVRALQQRVRDRDAKGLGRLAVDDELEFRWPQDRQIGWLRACEDLAGVNANFAIDVGEAHAVTQQAAGI